MHDAGISTSGDAEQWVEIAGQRYSHIVNPKTGLGLTGHQSVTVVAGDAMTSDMLATAVNVLGPDDGMALVEGTPGAAALVGTVSHGQRVLAPLPRLALVAGRGPNFSSAAHLESHS